MNTKLKGKVKDFRYAPGASFIVLVFSRNVRLAITTEKLDNYLTDIDAPYSFDFLFQKKSLDQNLNLLTDFYRSL